MIARFHYDDATLDRLRLDELGENEVGVVDHVETCEVCQQQLETLSRGGMSWAEVGELVGGSSSMVDEPDGQVDQVDGPEYEARSFLESSDAPGSIGRFARYEIEAILGRGGMGVVMRALDTSLGRHCAVKVLAPELAASSAARKRFSREARSAASIVHPHVVPIQTVDEHNGLPYLVMPIVEGQSLQQRVETAGPLSVVEAVRIASQIADGLAAAHAEGLVHRDIKPANVLLENGVERVQITDFGLARAVDDASMTRSGVIAGTPQYMSPEQAHGDSIDYRSDLFSLGSVLYFMLTGRSPFRAESTMGVLNRIGNDDPRSLQSINPDVPPWLEQIAGKLLSKSTADRYQTAQEVAELLRAWNAHLQQPDITPRPSIKNTGETSHNQTVSAGDSGSRVRRYLIGSAAFSFFFCLAGIFVLESGKGTIRIETNSMNPVPVVIRHEDEVIKELMVRQVGSAIRLRAGQYVIELPKMSSSDSNDLPKTKIEIVGDKVTLSRGETWVARIETTTPIDDQTETIKKPNPSSEGFADLNLSAKGAAKSQNSKPIDSSASPHVVTWDFGMSPPTGGDESNLVLVQYNFPFGTKLAFKPKFGAIRFSGMPVQSKYRAGAEFDFFSVSGGRTFKGRLKLHTIDKAAKSYLANNAIPIEVSEDDFHKATAGSRVAKAVYLPDTRDVSDSPGPAEVLSSTHIGLNLDPGEEANRRGILLAEIELTNGGPPWVLFQDANPRFEFEPTRRTSPSEGSSHQSSDFDLKTMTAKSPVFGDEKLTLDGTSNEQIAESAVLAVKQLTAEFIRRQRSIERADVTFRLRDSNGDNSHERVYRVRLSGRKRRSDLTRFTEDGGTTKQTIVLTPTHGVFHDHKVGEMQTSDRDPNEPVGWTYVANIPDIRKFGLVAWWPESIISRPFDKNLFPAGHRLVEIQNLLYQDKQHVVASFGVPAMASADSRHTLTFDPSQSMLPVKILTRWTSLDEPSKHGTIRQTTQWKEYDQIWFPKRIEFTHEFAGKTSSFTLETESADFDISIDDSIFEMSSR